jgi:uncharacterized protein (TIGR02147 family)
MKDPLSLLYHSRNYRQFLTELMNSYPNGGRGLRSRWATAIGCQVPFITHVLAGRNELSPEQAEATARFFILGREGTEFFILLVSFNRASTRELKNLFEKMLDEKSSGQLQLKAKLKIDESMSPSDQMKYYSTWVFSAVHMALTLQNINRIEDIAEKIGTSVNQVHDALDFLKKKGFVSELKGVFQVRKSMWHLDRDSAALLNHHSNWRHRAIVSFPHEKDGDLHYSAAVTLSKNDRVKVREIFANAIKQSVEVIAPSKEEKICGVCVDFFEL